VLLWAIEMTLAECQPSQETFVVCCERSHHYHSEPEPGAWPNSTRCQMQLAKWLLDVVISTHRHLLPFAPVAAVFMAVGLGKAEDLWVGSCY